MRGWFLKFRHVLVDSLYHSEIVVLLLIFVDRGLGVIQPEILSGTKDQSCKIQSADGDPALENRTLSFRTHAQDT